MSLLATAIQLSLAFSPFDNLRSFAAVKKLITFCTFLQAIRLFADLSG